MNRRSFLLSTGLTVIAAPVLGMPNPAPKSKVYQKLADFMVYYKSLPIEDKQWLTEDFDNLLEVAQDQADYQLSPKGRKLLSELKMSLQDILDEEIRLTQI